MHIKSLNNKHGKYSATFSRIFSGDKITCIGKLWKYNVCVFMNNFKCKSLSYFRVAFIFIESIKKFLIQLFNFQNVKMIFCTLRLISPSILVLLQLYFLGFLWCIIEGVQIIIAYEYD